MYWYRVKYVGSNRIFYFIAKDESVAVKWAKRRGPIESMDYVYLDSHAATVVRQVSV